MLLLLMGGWVAATAQGAALVVELCNACTNVLTSRALPHLCVAP